MNEEPFDSPAPEMESPPGFILTVSTLALDFMLARHGVTPNTEVRQTVISMLKENAPLWVEDAIHEEADRILTSN